MSLFAVTFEYTDDPAAQAGLRPERYAYFQRLQADGRLLASGQLTGQDMPQGLLLLTAASVDDAATLLDEDPFARAGLVARRRIGQWHATLGTALPLE